MENKMIMPFELGRSGSGRAVTMASEIDASPGVPQSEVNDVGRGSVVNATLLYSLGPSTFAQVLAAVAADPKDGVQTRGVVLTYLTDDGWKSKQWNGTGWSTETNWTDFGGSSVGNVYNVTVEKPIQGYYTLSDPTNPSVSATHVSWDAKKAKLGLIISFEISAGIWKTYQYIGRTLTETNWNNPDNWKDFGSLAAGSETYLVIDELIGAPSAGEYYTLETAVLALIAYQNETNVNYAKKGLIISYKTGENEMETKQFQGEVSDFGEVGLWKDFGGGTDVDVTDEPEKDSEKAFSAGGAYNLLPTGLKVDTETEGIVKIQLENAEGDGIGDEVQFAVGSGGGGGGGTIVTAAFEQSPLYGNAGTDFIIRAAVRSVTTVGQTEQENTIATIALYDRDTNTMLEVFNFNKASSASMSTYDFEMNVSEYFKAAGVRRFRCLITDDGGNTGSRNINVTAVDVTVTSVQTLQYTQATSLSVGGATKSIPLYKFANNSSDKGITAITEIYLNGEWQQLGSSLVTDTYSHGITINPNNCLGNVLTHGSYPIRVHGVDVASGVVGNYLYSSVFVIDKTSTVPLVAESWTCEGVNASVKLYETISLKFAVYDPTDNAPTASVYLDGNVVQSHTAYTSMAYEYTHQVTGVVSDGSFSHIVKVGCRTYYGTEAVFNVHGSVIDAALKSGAIYAFDFANRSNDEPDHSIVSGGKTITVNGSNWSTTGFVPMTPGGEMALRIAEDVDASLDHQPFKPTSIEANGMAIQFAFASKNLVDDNAVLMECFNEGVGAGFYVTGKTVGIYCSTGFTNHKEERAYRQGEKVSVAVVVEPAVEGMGQTRQGTTYYFIKLYLNGEEVAVIGYVAGQSNLTQEKPITWDGTLGDFYLYYMLAWEDYFQFDQAFQNYIVKLTNTEDMVHEFNFESVMASQAVTELGVLTTKLRPQATDLAERGMAYIIECPFNGSNIEGLDETVSTKEKIYVTLYYVDPSRPWTNFIARDVARRNQGTTSGKRPVKNPGYHFAQKKGSTYNKSTNTGGTTIELMYTREQIVAMGYDGALWDKAAALAAINKVQVHEDSIPVDIITVKVDFSDSSNANDCGVCDMMNATFKALGNNYMTPAQRAFDGTWNKGSVQLEGLVMNHSTANFPVAIYRSKEDTGSNPYFHAKGNWKEDKKEQVALGFKDVPGYNKGCLNYGDFIEFYGEPSETLAQTKTRFLSTSGLDTTAVYILTQYCGSSYKVMRYVEGQWTEQTGSMVQNANGKWTVTGDVLNPVDGFELLDYQDMCWFKGVSDVEDMMETIPIDNSSKWVKELMERGSISAETVPAWTKYFECLIDDDNLAIAYTLGKKVPYNLFRWMQFCDYCDYDKNGATGLSRWKNGLYRYASPYSCLSYDVFTDYKAAVDQRAKNMQPMWFLEDGCKVVNGVYYNASNQASDSTSGMLALRMYLNKVYDCDTCNGKDNDGGQTVDAEVDPNKMPDPQTGYINPYAGYNSVLFRNIFLQQSVYVDAQNTELSLKAVAYAMRSASITVDGITLQPFSPEGAMHFFVNTRIKRWQKKVSSYDGERKYIDFTSTTADMLYFYALQGLGLTSLPAFIERRWRIRDGFYGTGDFFKQDGTLTFRIKASDPNSKITFTAAKTGYFGIGHDSSRSTDEMVFLEAGQSHSFTAFSHTEGALIYIYQVDRMSMLDLSEVTMMSISDFGNLTLIQELYVGSEDHTEETGPYSPMITMTLGELPFLRVLDIRNTVVTTLDAMMCPRLESIYAADSQLMRVNIADGAKISYMQLPATYNYLKLRYLPNLTLEGLVLDDPSSIAYLICEENEKIDGMELLRSLISGGSSQLRNIRVKTVKTSGVGTDLTTLMGMNLAGFDAVGNVQDEPVIIGKYRLTRYFEGSEVEAYNAAFDGLVVKNVQYTGIEFTDTESDPENIKNLDNGTGYGTSESYAPSAHILNIWNKMHACRAKYNSSTHKMEVRALSDETYLKFANGEDFNPADLAGDGFDVMLRPGHFWYKGVNDFKNQKKYIFYSSVEDTPEASGEFVRKTLAQLTQYANKGVGTNGVNVGDTFTDASLSAASNLNSYSIDVTGMKQIRFPGVNISGYGAIFVNASNKVVGKFNMAISNTLFDFYDGSDTLTADSVETDYVFTDVPAGAVKCYLCCYLSVLQSSEVIATDSTEIEAIEPDWVEHEDNDLIGVYGASVDGMSRIRSVSGAQPKRGTGTSTTSQNWTYDSRGKVTNAIVPTGLNFTCKDFMNLAMMRGDGYQLIDYEQNKIMAILFWGMYGFRNDQAVIGNGTSGYNTTGVTDSIGKSSTQYGSTVNKLLGLEGFIACWYEWEDNIALNVSSWEYFKKNACVAASADRVDYKFRIYDPISGSERVVKAANVNSGYNVARIKLGRFCDTVVSKFDPSDSSLFVTYFCCYATVVGSTGRVVGRAYDYASVYGGLACANSSSVSSHSSTSYGSRLAFRGDIVEVAE